MTRVLIGMSLATTIIASACDSKGPELANFRCGWGAVCPPASKCDSCSGIDCSMPCYADVSCDPNASTADCPAGTVCDAASRYCLPAKTCSASSDCAATEFCVLHALSSGLCMEVVATAPGSCTAGEGCPFPWSCLNGACTLHCFQGNACPGTLSCVNDLCVP